MKKYIITEYKDLINIRKMEFYYILLKYILKCDIYIYKIPFLLETRNKIKKLIRDNLVIFYDSIKNIKEFREKEIVEYVLGVFIQYNWYLNQSIKEKERKSMSNSQFSSFQSNPMERQSAQSKNELYNDNNKSISSRGVFSGGSYLREKAENSGRSLESYEDLKTEYELLKEKLQNQNDVAFSILENSEFNLNVNKENKDLIKYSEININEKKYNISEIKKITSNNKIVNNNYQKLISFLDEIEKKIVNDCPHNREFNIKIKFTTEKVYESNFIINCQYKLEMSGEDTLYFKDSNILAIGFSDGFQYLIDELKNRD